MGGCCNVGGSCSTPPAQNSSAPKGTVKSQGAMSPPKGGRK